LGTPPNLCASLLSEMGSQAHPARASVIRFPNIIAAMSDLAQARSWPKRAQSLYGWTRHSSYLLAAFVLVCGCIIYFWWPLAVEFLAAVPWNGAWWHDFDWLLVGIYAVMTLLILAHADLKRDVLIIFVATLGGLIIESWGTLTGLWSYFTAERPPLWILPAWPIATLAIDRITRGLDRLLPRHGVRTFKVLYWLTFLGFYGLMLSFVAPTLTSLMTAGALLLCALLILTPTDARRAWLVFIAGTALGYFLELWGTTRQCWTYYTLQTPPLFAVLAHGVAAVSFWRAGLLVKGIFARAWGLLSDLRGEPAGS